MTEERYLQDPQAERLITGDTSGVGDSYRRVAEMLEALKTVQAVDSVREKATIAAMKAAIESPKEVRSLATPRTKTPGRSVRRIKVAGVAIGGMLTLMTSVAFAGGLPGAAQDKAHDFFGSIGIDVPAGDNAPDAADSRGDQADDTRQDGVSTQDAEDGSQISEDAKNITEDGDGEYLDDAADLAEDASDGKSTNGTDTAEESAGGAGPESGQEAAENGSGNSDDRP
jgi:hypothetical protein